MNPGLRGTTLRIQNAYIYKAVENAQRSIEIQQGTLFHTFPSFLLFLSLSPVFENNGHFKQDGTSVMLLCFSSKHLNHEKNRVVQQQQKLKRYVTSK